MDMYLLKFPYRKMLEPLAQKLLWVDPDLLGYIAAFVALFTGICFYYAGNMSWLLLAAIVLTFLRMTLNTIDGVIAIARGKKDIRGEIVNALPDRYSDIFVFCGIALSPYCNFALGILGLSSVFLVSYTGMLGKAIGVNWQHQGPLGKVERLIMVMIASLAQYIILAFDVRTGFSAFDVLMVVFIVLGQVAVFNRLKGMLREIREKENMEKAKEKVETTIVVYDSSTGNTEKVAKEVARGLGCSCYRASNIPHPVNHYDLVVFGTPDIRANAISSIKKIFDEAVYPRSYALFVTYGMPAWGEISSRMLINRLKRSWAGKSLRYLGSFRCPGIHAKYGTYKGRPSAKDLSAAYEFGKRIRERFENLSFGEKLGNTAMSMIIKSVGRLSKGVSMSFKYGFTSGLMLDYIYNNQPSGSLLLGKWIDRLYLGNPGWQSIRQRKANLKEHLKKAIQENESKSVRTVILDIASGPARYLIEVLKETGGNVSAMCQDIDARWMEEGRKIAGREGVRNITFNKGDAFDRESLLRVSPAPNIIVSSGFYDWITDENLIKRSFHISYEMLLKGGKIIFTNQSGHLQMDLVKRTFLDFTGKPLVMEVRPIEQMNSWAKEAGFVNLRTDTDKWGLYSVSTGEKL